MPDVVASSHTFQAGRIIFRGIIAILRSLRAGGDKQRVRFELPPSLNLKKILFSGANRLRFASSTSVFSV